MSRVPYPDPEGLSSDTQDLLAKMAPAGNIFRMMAGGEGLLRAFTKLGNHILFKSALDPVLREVAIIRVGVLSAATYEVHHHEHIGRRLGMPDELIRGIHDGPDAAVFDDAQREVMCFTDDVVRHVRASDGTFEPLLDRLGLRRLEELTITVGFYMAVSRFLCTFDIEVEDDPIHLEPSGSSDEAAADLSDDVA